MSRLYCCTYPGFWVVYGARVGAPFVAAKSEIFPLRPGGGKIPFAPKGPASRHEAVKAANPPPTAVQPLASRLALGDRPWFIVAKNGVVARLIRSLSGLSWKET